MHLVDHARAHIEETYRRPLADRLLRMLLVKLLPRPRLFRYALLLALLGKPFGPLVQRAQLDRVGAMLRLAPWKLPASSAASGRVVPAEGPRQRARCAAAGLRCAASFSADQRGCRTCARRATGSRLFMWRARTAADRSRITWAVEQDALSQARANIDAWTAEIERGGLDAIVITASGCGTTVKDYGYMLRTDPAYAEKAARVSALARDITEYLTGLELTIRPTGAAATQGRLSRRLFASAWTEDRPRTEGLAGKSGLLVAEIPEGHLCCGSAGTYNMLQPVLATALRDRKAANIAQVAPDVIAAGNIGCILKSPVPRPFRSSIPSNCWTGPAAGRHPPHCRNGCLLPAPLGDCGKGPRPWQSLPRPARVLRDCNKLDEFFPTAIFA